MKIIQAFWHRKNKAHPLICAVYRGDTKYAVFASGKIRYGYTYEKATNVLEIKFYENK